MNAFMRKEFRESVRWLPLGWLLMTGLLWITVPGLHQMDKVPRLHTELFFYTCVGSAFIALGLSIAQFAPDQRSSARAFLLHRGLSPTQLYQGKLFVGMGIYALAIGIPLLVCTIYLESIGPLRLPTSARQTVPSWVAVIFSFSFYLGGCMVICSPARWIGTRVLPLGTAFPVACASGGILQTEWMWWAGTALSLGVFGLVVLGRASQDAFLNANHRAAPSQAQRNDKSRSFVLICASILTSATLILLPLSMAEPRIHYRSVQHEIDASGELWFVLLLRGQPIQRAKMTLEKNALIEDLPETWATSSGAWTTTYMRTPSAQSSTSYWSGYELESSRADTPYFDPRGYVLVYKSIPPAGPGLNSSWMLSYVVGQDRVSRVGETRGIPFASDPDVDGSFDSKTIITRDGVFCYNVNTGEVVQAVSLAVKAFSVDVTKTDRNLYLYGADKLFIYRKVGNQSASSNGLELEASIDVGPDFIGIGSTELWYKNKDHLTALAWAEPSLANRSPYQVVQKRPGQDLKVFRPSIPDGMQGDEAGLPLIGIILVGFAAPALYFLLIFVVVAVVNFFEFPRDGLIGFVQGDELVTAIIAIAIQIILSCLVAYTAARHRGLSKNARMGWSIAGAFLGFGIGLAIMAIYQRCIREKCDHCQKLRHVDLDTCEHCENGWDPPPQEGIEIVDVKKRPAQLECASA